MTAPDRNAPDPNRVLRRAGLIGSLLVATTAGVLWLGADVVGTRECMDHAYGLGVEGGGSTMTEKGCEVTVPTTTMGPVTAALPTLNEPLAATALVVGIGSAVPPVVRLWLSTRRPR